MSDISTPVKLTRGSTGNHSSQYQDSRAQNVADSQIEESDGMPFLPFEKGLKLNKCGILKIDKFGWSFDPIATQENPNAEKEPSI